MIHWVEMHEILLLWLASSSLVTFIFTLVVVPLLVVRIPADYFVHEFRERPPIVKLNPVLGFMLKLFKNILGFIFVVTGILLLVLPGQGLLTILVGLMLMKFPGKDRLVRWLVSRKLLLCSINWLRRHARKEPLQLSEKCRSGS